MDNVYLIGAEDVRSAGSTISSAASTMQRAASQMDEALRIHRQYLDEWLHRLEEVLKCIEG